MLNDLLDICFKDGYEYIARMDADDISMQNRFEKQMTYLHAHPEIDVVGGAIEEIDENSDSRGKEIFYPVEPKDCYEFSQEETLTHIQQCFSARVSLIKQVVSTVLSIAGIRILCFG